METRNKEFDKCGPFQIYHVGLTQLTRFSAAWTLSLMMFGNFDPGWKCLKNRHSAPNTSTSSTSSLGPTHFGYYVNQSTSPMEQFNVLFESHLGSGNSGDYDDSNNINNITFLVNSSACRSLDICDVIEFNPSAKTLVSEFRLICDQSFIPSIIISIQMVGMLIGCYVSGQLGEWYGRRIALFGCTAVSALSCFLGIFAPSWEVFSVFIFFNGVGGGGIMTTCGLYGMEFLQPKWRARLVGIPIYNVALTLFTVALILLRDWVYVQVATTCVAAIACLGVFWSPESLRWLLLHGKEKEAKAAINKINKYNKGSFNVEEVMGTLATINENESDVSKERKYSYLDLFRSSGTRSILLKTSIIWFFTIMAYYALTFSVKSLSGNFYINALVAAVSEIPAVILVTPVLNKLGRRWGVAIFLVGAMLGYFVSVAVYFTADYDFAQNTIRLTAFIARGSTVACVNALNVLSVELFPTAVRNVGVAFLSIMGRVGAISAPYLIPRDQQSLIISYVVLGVASIINAITVLSLPETNNKSLQDHLLRRGAKTEKETNSENIEA